MNLVSFVRANTNINLKEIRIMSENQMKDRIVGELKKAKEALKKDKEE